MLSFNWILSFFLHRTIQSLHQNPPDFLLRSLISPRKQLRINFRRLIADPHSNFTKSTNNPIPKIGSNIVSCCFLVTGTWMNIGSSALCLQCLVNLRYTKKSLGWFVIFNEYYSFSCITGWVMGIIKYNWNTQIFVMMHRFGNVYEQKIAKHHIYYI